jgi:hypothetical protein
MISTENFEEIISAIYEFEKLPEDWNLQCALKIENIAIKRAIRFLHVLNEKGILRVGTSSQHVEVVNLSLTEKSINEPSINYGDLTIYPTTEGGITFSWSCWFVFSKVIIPPEKTQGVLYECVSLNDTYAYEIDKEGKSFDYWEIAEILHDHLPY